MFATDSASFWERNGFEESERDVCIRAVQKLYPEYEVGELNEQGYCSFTVRLCKSSHEIKSGANHEKSGANHDLKPSDKRVVQFRPPHHALDVAFIRTARETYGPLVPSIEQLHFPSRCLLHAYEMPLIPGTPYSRLQPQTRHLSSAQFDRQRKLLKSLARLLAKAYPKPNSTSSTPWTIDNRTTRADSPMSDIPIPTPSPPSTLQTGSGKVGAILIQKIELLTQKLPSAPLREYAAKTLSRLLSLPATYPLVPCHGDLIPSNILIDEDKGEISGVVDWAEGECLPFGTCFYGVDYFLGFLSRSHGRGRTKWKYYVGSGELRDVFWDELGRCCGVHDDEEEKGWREEVDVLRDVGVLLWFGYAWDGGRIDRVVDGERDGVEVECLRGFLDVGQGSRVGEIG